MTGTAPATARSLASPEALAMVGREVSRATGVVVRREFQRWAAAVGDTNPLWFDPEHARAYGYRDAVCPPLFLPLAVLGVVRLSDLRPDGVPEGFLGMAPLPLTPRLMAGGEAYEFLAPAYDGDEVTGVRVVESVTEKQGRTGPFLAIVSRTTFTGRDGTVFLHLTDTVLARP
jgi:acyl dehydratase